jgi:type VII secretion protein EccCa/type VII secretion protein EccCb
MARQLFDTRRRLPAPTDNTGDISVEAPPELPRMIPPRWWEKGLPLFMILIVLGFVALIVLSGRAAASPMYLIFPFMMLFTVMPFMMNRGSQDLSTPAVNAERADYLRYLSRIRDKVRKRADGRRNALLWSNPDPADLALAAGTRRQWERSPNDKRDYLHVRVGRHTVPAGKINISGDRPSELDLEPVCYTALDGLRDYHQSVRNCPLLVDLSEIARITLYRTDPHLARRAVSAWLAELVTWHSPDDVAVAVVCPELEQHWGWLKWLAHVDTDDQIDGAGAARYLTSSTAECARLLGPLLADRNPDADGAALNKHVAIVVDDPDADPAEIVPTGGLRQVSVIWCRDGGPGRDYEPAATERVLHISQPQPDAPPVLRQWERFAWRPYAEAADVLAADDADHLARRLARWDANPAAVSARSASRAAGFTGQMGIANAARLDLDTLMAPRTLDDELRVPIAVCPNGEPLWFDFKDEADGGMGPHGMMLGMTGSGKSKTIESMLLPLLVTHPADRLIVIWGDYKGGSGADAFKDFPQVLAIITDMANRKTLADRFADTLLGIMDDRQQQLETAGQRFQGATYNSVTDYRNDRAQHPEYQLPPIPTLLVVVDEFSLLLLDRPELAAVFDKVARKGRSLAVHFLFASQTLDYGRIKDIDKNITYKIGLKVASPSISRQIISTEDAYHIPQGKANKGVGFLVPAPGALPIKFRSNLMPKIYEPPRTQTTTVVHAPPRVRHFTAGQVAPDPFTVTTSSTADNDDVAAPAGPPKSLVATIAEQVAARGPHPRPLWTEPLDDPIPLDALTTAAPAPVAGQLSWPLGEIDEPRKLRRSPLIFDAASPTAANVMLVGGPGSGLSTAIQTFVLSAAARYSPADVQFYCLNYGGAKLPALQGLPHVKAVAGQYSPDLIRRVFNELNELLRRRQQLFQAEGVSGMADLRARRAHRRWPHDDTADVFLIVDNLAMFLKDNTTDFNPKNPLKADVETLALNGLSYGIHLLITCGTWMDATGPIGDHCGFRLEFRLADPTQSVVRIPAGDMTSGVIIRPAERLPLDQPGRALNPNAAHIRICLPRLDSKTIDAGVDDALAEAVATINHTWSARDYEPATKTQALPTRISAAELGGAHATTSTITIGQRERDLGPAVIDFDADSPLVAVYGNRMMGRTTLLRRIVTVVMGQPASETALVTIDPRRTMADLSIGEKRPDDVYVTRHDQICEQMAKLAEYMRLRRPPEGLSAAELRDWKPAGPTVYVVVDDVEQIPALGSPPPGGNPAAAGPPTWGPLLDLAAAAADLKLRIIIARQAGGLINDLHSAATLPGRFKNLGATTILLAGDPAAGKVFQDLRMETGLPPGRARLGTRSQAPDYIQIFSE